ncbi:hypothetical protein MNBD_GAMMA12-505 [hydrothermal vent metagenome]|uniref:DUF5666 domain-containing protein n=1 Tax=hydrothermal vent metagenome TaxID=652676 RepID=A0A3B0XXG4_9ZZZZ
MKTLTIIRPIPPKYNKAYSYSTLLCITVLILTFSVIQSVYADGCISDKTQCKTNNQGIGGTGKIGDRGIGGTGKSGDRGIGGTGKQLAEGTGIGGTGIIGVITAIPNANSFTVNGVQVFHTPTTTLYINNSLAKSQSLRVGQRVTLYTTKKGKTTTANRINVNYILIGPVQYTNQAQYSFLAAGQKVVLHQSIRNKIKKLKAGHTVLVSGLRKHNGIIIATAVNFYKKTNNQQQPPLTQVSGQLTNIGKQHYTLNGLSIKVKQSRAALDTNMVTVYGRYTKHGFQLNKIEEHPRLPFKGVYKHFILEGLLSKSLNSNILSLNGTSIILNEKTSILGAPKTQLVTDTRVFVDVHLDSNSRMTADRIHIRSDRFERLDRSKPDHRTKTSRPDTKDDKSESRGNDDHSNDDNSNDDNNNDDNRNDDNERGDDKDSNRNDDSSTEATGAS